MQESLVEQFQAAGVEERLIAAVVESGYFIKGWASWGAAPRFTVSDPFYGNKTFSSNFETPEFIRHINGERPFKPLPPLVRERVRTLDEIRELLRDERRSHYQREGSLAFRGQPREYRIRRQVPNPLRGDTEGRELSIMPGVYRQEDPERYSLAIKPKERRTIQFFAREFESAEADHPFAIDSSYDLMRTEQHYATQTAGLDVSFDLPTALFFATHQFATDEEGRSFFRPIPRGEHMGMIYLFRFGSPPVRKTEFLIRDFDFFRTYRPERILRQACGLPLFGAYERNIAVTDIDCIIELDPNFEGGGTLTPEYMFPAAHEDAFYRKLLELKDWHPEQLKHVVEYQWARGPKIANP